MENTVTYWHFSNHWQIFFVISFIFLLISFIILYRKNNMVIKKIEEFISSKICSVPEAVCMNQPHVIRHESLIAQIQLRLEKLENDVEVQLATHNKFSNEINGSLSQVKEQVTLLNFKMDEFSRRYDKDRI